MENKNELFKALSLAQGEIENATKNSTNPHFRSKYADLAECINATKDALSKNGLCVIQLINKTETGVVLETILGHSSGQSISSYTPLLFSKNDMQGLGSATTYARRYALSSILGLSQEDDDGNASKSTTSQKKTDDDPYKHFPPGLVRKYESPTHSKPEDPVLLGEIVINTPLQVHNGSFVKEIEKHNLLNLVSELRERLKIDNLKETNPSEYNRLCKLGADINKWIEWKDKNKK